MFYLKLWVLMTIVNFCLFKATYHYLSTINAKLREYYDQGRCYNKYIIFYLIVWPVGLIFWIYLIISHWIHPVEDMMRDDEEIQKAFDEFDRVLARKKRILERKKMRKDS